MQGYDPRFNAMEPQELENRLISSLQDAIGYNTPSKVPMDRAPLLSAFRERMGFADESEDEIYDELKRRYNAAVARSLGLSVDDKRLEGEVARWRPLWENNAQKQAIMSIASEEDGLKKLNEMFPGSYVPGEEHTDHQMDSLLPPGSLGPVEAQRALDYWARLIDSRPLEYSDVALGRHEPSSFMRDDKTNWFSGNGIFKRDANIIGEGELEAQGPYAHEDGVPSYTGFGGPNNRFAQESPIGVELFQNPAAWLTGGVVGAQNALVQGHKYAASGGLGGYDRGLRKFSLDLANKSHMGETPTAGITIRDENGNIRRHFQRDVRDEAERKAKIARDVMPDEGQPLLEAVGVDDRNNTVLGALGFTAGIDVVDHNFGGTLSRSIPRRVQGQLRFNPEIMYDVRNEGAFALGQGSGQEGAFADQIPRKPGDPGFGVPPAERVAAREVKRGPAFEAMESETPESYSIAQGRDKSPIFQKLTATNKFLAHDQQAEADEAYRRDRAQLEKIRSRMGLGSPRISGPNTFGAF